MATTPLLPTATGLPLVFDNAGTADLLADVSGLSGLTLAAGQSSLTTIVAALTDEEVEVEETLLLSLPNSDNSVLLTLRDTLYGAWASAALGTNGETGALQDFDQDGSPNIEEYVFQTDGSDPLSTPTLATSISSTHFKLLAPPVPLPSDVLLDAQASSDLQVWTSTGVEDTGDGFQVPLGGDERFLRFLYTLSP